ncbi:enoyl-CoA hydratase/isomerase family protein [Anaerotignum sp.]|uniref:enoyl-CoA hydratase/isomerase family protein n=1 Tax=Anaerotignum sp. TaxID=2039241 RepID=UPI002A90DC8C|nr:enoyl-CoA hydratase/isomerase family protein [Anaerotignum sp.]MCI7658020.1 enoyl-CoA hydratase/isomerase family protein [Clostridia bacterium]MDY5414130.1 enoyl-CoA hydratase/isomerase family protein [Anaerotignum sp.]
MNEIRYTVRNHIATIHLNRQPVGNAFSTEMMEKWCNIFAVVHQEKDIRCVIVKSDLPNAFTFGGDIKEEQHLKDTSARRFSHLGQACAKCLRDCPCPVIFSIHGYCLGAGLEFLLSADLVIAADDIQLGIPTIKLGEIPGFGGIGLLGQKIGYANAMDLLLTGRTLRGEEALRLGLVQYVIPAEELEQKTKELADTISGFAPLAIRKMKQVLRHTYDVTLEEQLIYETDAFMEICQTTDRKKAIEAFLHKKPSPTFQGK